MLKLDNYIQSREKLKSILSKTELIFSEVFSAETKNQIFLKPENFQVTGSFKVRGAYNKITKLSEGEKLKGVIASSAGNHAQGVALAATSLGIKSLIVMPKHSPLIKVEATKKLGAEVMLHGEVYDDAYKKACELQKERGYVFVHPFDDEDVIEGQGSIALEILEELPDADILMVPIGGGGLISGVASAAKAINPDIKIIGVEPEGAASAREALKGGGPVELMEASTIADGTAVKKIGQLSFQYIKEYVDEIITVSDYELMESFLLLVENHKLVAESSGILSLAGVKKLKVENKKIVCILSGGNIDVLSIASMINKGLVTRGRIFKFALCLPDKPGTLLKVTKILADLNANVKRFDHDQLVNFDSFYDVELQVTVETKGENHIRLISEEMEKQGFKIVRLNARQGLGEGW